MLRPPLDSGSRTGAYFDPGASGPWRYERVEGASHWMQLDRPDHVNRLLLDFLGESSSADRPAQ